MSEEKSETKKLFRSRVNRYIGGVSGGLGEYFNVDANVFRILFVLFTLFGGVGLIVYIAALLIVPENPSQDDVAVKAVGDKTKFWAILFIVVGALLLLRNFGVFHYFHFWQVPWSSIWAIFLIGIGIILIFSSNRPAKSGEEGAKEPAGADLSKIHRSKKNRMLAGVCSGIAEYFNIDPSLVRILWVLATLASVGLGILVYILLIFIFPEESDNQEIAES